MRLRRVGAAAFGVAQAGEDSTDRSGVAATGPEYFAKRQCGLDHFGGPGDEPCKAEGLKYDPEAKPGDPNAGPMPRVGRRSVSGGTTADTDKEKEKD